MKKLLIPFILFFAVVTVNTYSQSFTFVRTSPAVVYAAPDTMIEIISYGNVIVQNTPISIRLIRTVNNHSNTWATAICDPHNCYPSSVDTAINLYSVGTSEITLHFYDTAFTHTPGFGYVTIRAEAVTNPNVNHSVTFGASTFPVSIQQISSIIKEFNLNQNYPNPFNPATKIGFSIPKPDYVDLRVYDILGREVTTLLSQQLNEGEYEIEFDGKNLSSGMYYYRLQSGDYVSVKKMTLVK